MLPRPGRESKLRPDPIVEVTEGDLHDIWADIDANRRNLWWVLALAGATILVIGIIVLAYGGRIHHLEHPAPTDARSTQAP